MPAVITRLRAELRARWRAWAAVALLIGLVGSVVLTTAVGARRTDTAYARYLRRSHAADVLVSPSNRGLPDYYPALARLPQVAALGVGVGLQGFVPNVSAPAGAPASEALGAGFQVLAPADTQLGFSVGRPKVTAGRMFRADRADEAVAEKGLADLLHLHVGDTLHFVVAPTTASGADISKARPMSIKVVGLVVARDNVVPVNALASSPTLVATPALLRQFQSDVQTYETYTAFDGGFVRLKPGASRSAFSRDAQELATHYPETGAPDQPIFVADEHEQAAAVEHAIRPQAAALALFSLLAALSALFVLGQILSRQLFLAADENPTLMALGMGRNQLFALGLAEAGIVATAGAVLAAVIAALASPYTPIGPARIAEPHPGFAINWAILGIGLLATVALLVARVAWPAWRYASAHAAVEAENVDRPSRLVEEATRVGAPASAAVGIRLALEPGRGRTAVPVRSALAGTVVAVAAVAAAFTFGNNLVRLVHTPKLYGQTWSVAVDTQFGRLPPNATVNLLQKQKGVTGWTFGDHADVTIAGKNVATIGLTPGRGPELWPKIVDGRAPSAPDEIVLGSKTLAAAHRHVGDTIVVTPQRADRGQPMHIVGRAVFPFFGQGSFTPTGLGDGAAIQDPPRDASPDDPAGYNFVLVRMAPGTGAAAIASFRRNIEQATGLCPQDQVCGVETAKRPVDILNYTRIQATPLALAGLLALLAVATIAHLLVTSIRRRRRDLAVLKTMGFVRPQVSSAVAWQATTLVGVALLVGVPLGAAAGRWVWQEFAFRIGIAPDPRVPLITLLLFIPVAVVVANLLAAGPGWVAGRLKPAPVLRTE
ncbi:MAG TPA: FtsX-like permease family protein [Acidimicrobiales bacterium]|nr:FtsX-like permease family protein [Acidimicrobiales bacterium]